MRAIDAGMRAADTAATAHTEDSAGFVQEHPLTRRARPTGACLRSSSAGICAVDDRYFFPDRSQAFSAQGSRIKDRHHDGEVLHRIVAIAQACGWSIVAPSGIEEFCRDTWRAKPHCGASRPAGQTPAHDPDHGRLRDWRRVPGLRQSGKDREANANEGCEIGLIPIKLNA